MVESGKIQGTSQVEKPRLNNKNALKEQLSEGIVESEEISDKISGIQKFKEIAKLSDVSPSALKNEASSREN